jgi:hypothetical protein
MVQGYRDMNDHTLSKFLRYNNWTGKIEKYRNATLYTDEKGNVIATVYYDNKKCTKKVILHK